MTKNTPIGSDDNIMVAVHGTCCHSPVVSVTNKLGVLAYQEGATLSPTYWVAAVALISTATLIVVSFAVAPFWWSCWNKVRQHCFIREWLRLLCECH